MNFALVCVCVCVCQPAEWMWFTLHWPPVSHRQKLVSLVLMGCRAEKEGAVRMWQQGCCWGFEEVCVLVSVRMCGSGYLGEPFLKLHFHSAIVRPRDLETRYRPYKGTICFSFVCTDCVPVCACVCACTCVGSTYLMPVFWRHAQPRHSSALTLLNTHNLDSLRSVNK